MVDRHRRPHLVRAAARLARRPAARPARRGDAACRSTSRTRAAPAPSPRSWGVRRECRPQQRLRVRLGLGRPRRRHRRQRRGASAAGTTSPASSATCRSTSTARRARAARPAAGRRTCPTSRRCRATSAASSRRASRSPPRSRRSPWTTSSPARAAATPRRSRRCSPPRATWASASASVVNAVDPARIFLSGEIIAAWDLLETTVRQALASARPRAGRLEHRDHAGAVARPSAVARRGRPGDGAALRRAAGWLALDSGWRRHRHATSEEETRQHERT